MCTSLTSHTQKQKCCKLLVQMKSTLCHGFIWTHYTDATQIWEQVTTLLHIIYLVTSGGGGVGYNEMAKIPKTPKWSPKIPRL
jgi:hypothetical protein